MRAVRLRADGRHLDHVVPVRQAFCGQRADFAGAVRRLPQREDAERERAAHLESLLPILCPADAVEPWTVLPDLGFVEGCCDARQSCLNLLPYRFRWPRCWTWASAGPHCVGISARSHVDAATLRRAPWTLWQGKEHMAKLSVNAMIGLWARSTEVVYSVRSSSELDGAHADFS